MSKNTTVDGPLLFLGLLGFACCCWLFAAIDNYRPTPEQRYQERVLAHYNLPEWLRGDFPRRDDPIR